ncbi:MAG TPA: hypothetical protein VIZ44_13455, partial [Gaiellaceae bacterium]
MSELRICPIELFEDPFSICHGDSSPLVADRDEDLAVSDLDANPDPICVAVLDGVVEKVHEYLAETVGVARCRGQLARYLDVESHRLKLRFHCRDRCLYDLADLDRLLVDPNFAVVELARQQHLLCNVSEAFRFGGEHLEKFVPLFAVKLVIAVQ